MRISCQSFSLPKAGRSFADCEDAYFPGELDNRQINEVSEEHVTVFRASVCDGATDSIFSKLWAQLLACSYGAGKWDSTITAESIRDEQSAWSDFVARQELPWYAEEKAELGAFAALIGLTLHDQSKKWTAMALGDCCVFQTRNGECIKAFPITESSAFSNFPMLLSSVADRNANVFESKKIIADCTWQSGDLFILMSDTVACWFLSRIEAGEAPAVIGALDSLHTLDAFVSLINHARTARGADGNVLMRDDDVTVTLIRVADDSSAPLPKRFDEQALLAAVRPTVEMSKPAMRGDLPVSKSSEISAPGTATSSPSSSPFPSSSSSSSSSSRADFNDIANDVQNRSRARSLQGPARKNPSGRPSAMVVIAFALIVTVGAVAAFITYSHKQSEKKSGSGALLPKSKTTKQAPTVSAEGDGASPKSGAGHHRGKHKSKEGQGAELPAPAPAHAIAPDTAPNSKGTSGKPGNEIGRNGSDHSGGKVTSPDTPPDVPSEASPDTPPKQPASVIPPHGTRQFPQTAPDRASSNINSSRRASGFPSVAPDRVQMPMPAPDRNSAVPVPLPEHVRQDRGGGDQIHPIGKTGRHHRSAAVRGNGPVGSITQPPDQISPDTHKNDLPENLSN